jgi:hypothetical protein
MVRSPIRSLACDTITPKHIRSATHLAELQNAMGWCMNSLAGDLPIYTALSRHLINSDPVSEAEYSYSSQYLAHGMSVTNREPCLESRLSFFRAFGITPDNQLAIERIYDKLQPYKGMPTPMYKIENNKTLEQLIKDTIF